LPNVSVVVPNYNYARYLPERLDSIFRQTHPVREVIELDDHSRDDIIAVILACATQAGRDIELVTSKRNSGSPFAQCRKAVAMARGDYIWIAEADDIAATCFLDRLVSQMEESGADIGFTDSWQIDADGTKIGASYIQYLDQFGADRFAESFIMSGRDFLARHLSVANVILNVSAVVLRKSVLADALSRLGPALDDYRLAGDWRLYAEICALGGKVVYCADALNGHRRHDTSVTHALDPSRHLAEIRSVQDAIGSSVTLDPATVTAQRRHLRQVEIYLTKRASEGAGQPRRATAG
jgi:glycosyltransferase involved in cell wall biosynthesis